MPERPIIFSGPMVRAILEGRKAQTRRVVKPQPTSHHYLQPMWGTSPDGFEFGERGLWREVGPDYPDAEDDDRRCPYGQPGDRLWVRETWGLHAPFDFTDWCRDSIKGLSADDVLARWELDYRADWEQDHEPNLWRSPIHMPRWASRLTLEMTGVRLERLQEISEADAYAEGVQVPVATEGCPPGKGRPLFNVGSPYADPKRATVDHAARWQFAAGWDGIHGGRPWRCWDDNPWVWVIEFRRCEQTRKAVGG